MTSVDLEASQHQLGNAVDRARMGEDRDLASQVRDTGERFVRQLFGALRLTRIHDLGNAVFDKPVQELCTSLGELERLLGAIHLVAVEGQVYINDVRVRLDERLDTAAQLGRELGRHDVGGISFHAALPVPSMKSLIDAFGAEPAEEKPRTALRSRLQEQGLTSIDLLGAYRFRVGDEPSTASRADTQKVRDRAVSLVDATVDALGADRMPNPLPVRRAVTELLEMGSEAELLSSSSEQGSSFAQHTLRISMLAVVIGKELGLEQATLQDLGVAAMFHDVGYSTREGATDATDDEPAHPGYAPPYDRHASAGARVLLRQRGFHESKILRALAALHHTRRYDHPSGRPTLFGRIIAICEAYDAMTVLGPQTVSPPQALATLQAEAGTVFDPVLVQALVNGLGRYPPGTHVSVSPSIEGVVVGLPEGKADWDKPKVRVVSSGTDVVEAGSVLDMAHFPGSIAARG